VFHSDPVIVGLTVVGVGVPVATYLGWLPGRQSTPPAAARADELPAGWRLSHKLGNVFALTNLAGVAASDVDVAACGPDLDVKPRGAPWTTVLSGDTVEFVVVARCGRAAPETAGAVVISWKTSDGTPLTARTTIEPALLARTPSGPQPD
jgi:hypothetical protein